jgi:hypothetical protein
MNMRMPGFTADPTVYGSGGLMYGMAGAMVVPAQGAVVEPLASFCTTVFNGCRFGVCVRLQLCALPPSACIRITAFGATILNRCFP